MDSEIIAAIEELNLIEMVYENQWMVVQPYCYGIFPINSECIIAYIVESQASQSVHTWGIYELEKASDFNILKETFSPTEQLPEHLKKKLPNVFIRL